MIIPAQLCAARALLNWSREECGHAIGISEETVRNIESERYKPSKATVAKVLRTLSEYGVELIGHHRLWGVVLIRNGKNHAGGVGMADSVSKEHKK